MLNNGYTGWKVLLPNYNGRSGLRVHPDTNSPGTKGCIGIVGCYEELKSLSNFFNKYIGPSGKNRMRRFQHANAPPAKLKNIFVKTLKRGTKI